MQLIVIKVIAALGFELLEGVRDSGSTHDAVEATYQNEKLPGEDFNSWAPVSKDGSEQAGYAYWAEAYAAKLPDVRGGQFFCLMVEHLLQGPLAAAQAMSQKQWKVLAIPKSSSLRIEGILAYTIANIPVYNINYFGNEHTFSWKSKKRSELLAAVEQTKFGLYSGKQAKRAWRDGSIVKPAAFTNDFRTAVTAIVTSINSLTAVGAKWARDKAANLVIWDHGGYTANHKSVVIEGDGGLLMQTLGPPWKLLLLMEHTMNGHLKFTSWRYDGINLPVPGLSCARARVKEHEDNLIGGHILESIAKSVHDEWSQDTLFDGFLEEDDVALMIGMGRIGKGFAIKLASLRDAVPSTKEKHSKLGVVAEVPFGSGPTLAKIAAEANAMTWYLHAFSPEKSSETTDLKACKGTYSKTLTRWKSTLSGAAPSLYTQLTKTKLLFSGTGHKPIGQEHMPHFPGNVVLAGATSYDDEFVLTIPPHNGRDHSAGERSTGLRLQPYRWKSGKVLQDERYRARMTCKTEKSKSDERGTLFWLQDGGLSANLVDSWDIPGLWISIIRLQFIKIVFFNYMITCYQGGSQNYWGVTDRALKTKYFSNYTMLESGRNKEGSYFKFPEKYLGKASPWDGEDTALQWFESAQTECRRERRKCDDAE